MGRKTAWTAAKTNSGIRPMVTAATNRPVCPCSAAVETRAIASGPALASRRLVSEVATSAAMDWPAPPAGSDCRHCRSRTGGNVTTVATSGLSTSTAA